MNAYMVEKQDKLIWVWHMTYGNMTCKFEQIGHWGIGYTHVYTRMHIIHIYTRTHISLCVCTHTCSNKKLYSLVFKILISDSGWVIFLPITYVFFVLLFFSSSHFHYILFFWWKLSDYYYNLIEILISVNQ